VWLRAGYECRQAWLTPVVPTFDGRTLGVVTWSTGSAKCYMSSVMAVLANRGEWYAFGAGRQWRCVSALRITLILYEKATAAVDWAAKGRAQGVMSNASSSNVDAPAAASRGDLTECL